MTRWLHPFLVLALLLALPPAGHAQPKDTLTVALVSHAPTLDPHMHFERVGILVNINMFDSLLHRNTKLEYEPSLATSWKAVSDTQWEFKLRKGVKFHNGDPLTAEDVKFSFDRVLEPGKEKKKSPQYGNIRAIKEVRIVDADTVHLITDKPFPLLLERLVFFPIVPKKHIEKVGDEAFGTTAAGRDRALEVRGVEARPVHPARGLRRHWRGKPAFKHLVIRAVPEVATQIAEMKTGRRGPDPQRLRRPRPRAEVASADLRVARRPSCACTTSSSTCASPPFDKKAVRQAANYAIDKQAIIQKLMGGLGQQVATVVQPLAFGFDAEVTPFPYDPKKAKELLAQAGFPNGVDITAHSAFVEFRPVFEAIAQMLTEVGLRTNARMWDPGPAWNKFFQAEGKATNAAYGIVGQLLGLRRRRRPAPALPHRAGRLDRQALHARGGARQADRRGALHGGPAAPEADLLADPEADPRGGARHLPVHPVRHAGHLQEGRVRRPRRRVALALRRQAQEVGVPGPPVTAFVRPPARPAGGGGDRASRW